MKSLAQDKDTQIKDAEKLFTEIENSFKLELDKLLARLATCRSATLQIISEQSDEEHNRLMTNYTNREKVFVQFSSTDDVGVGRENDVFRDKNVIL